MNYGEGTAGDELALARRQRLSAQPCVVRKRGRRERRERGALRNGPAQPVVGQVHEDELLEVGRERGGDRTRELVVVERQVVQALQIAEASGNGAGKRIPAHVEVAELRQRADLHRQRPRELVVRECKVGQALLPAYERRHPARELVVVQVEIL
jgi:hypothetical protein